MQNVLILTSKNSARSQMLEGWLRYYAKKRIAVESAGLEEAPLDAFAVKAMMEAVVDIRTAKSTMIGEADVANYDFVITLTQEATTWMQTNFPEKEVEEKLFDDPKLATGEEMERLKVYRKSVDEVDDFAINFVFRKVGMDL